MIKKAFAEFFGTFWLVLGGCGSAVLAAAYPDVGIGFVGVSLAFGLSVVTMAYAIGHISGCHLNPAVSIGLTMAGKHDSKLLAPYIMAQLLGAVTGAGILFLIASGKPGFEIGNFAANGYGPHSPDGYGMASAFLTELFMTFFFLFIIFGATHEKAPKGFAGLTIGLGLTMIHLISIPVTNTSVNPARSTSQALFAEGTWAIPQLWLFWIAPILGAVLAGVVYQYISSSEPEISTTTE